MIRRSAQPRAGTLAAVQRSCQLPDRRHISLPAARLLCAVSALPFYPAPRFPEAAAAGQRDVVRPVDRVGAARVDDDGDEPAGYENSVPLQVSSTSCVHK